MSDLNPVPQAQEAPATPATPAAAPAVATPAAPAKEVSLRDEITANFDKSKEASTLGSQKPGEKPAAKPPVDGKPPEGEAKPIEGKPDGEKLRTDRIPPGWKGGAQTWHALGPEAKTFIADRERQYNMGIQRYSQAASFAQEMYQEFQPYEALLRSVGTTPQMATRFLLGHYYTVRAGTPAQKQQLIHELARDAGVDLGSIQGEAPPQVDQNVAQLQEQVRGLTDYIHRQHNSVQVAESSEINRQIGAFAEDPANEHFETVRPAMAALLSNGQATDLKDAYDKACWANTEVRASRLNQLNAQDAEKRRKQAEAAQGSAVQVTGAPPAPVVGDSDLSIRGLLQKQFAAGGRA